MSAHPSGDYPRGVIVIRRDCTMNVTDLMPPLLACSAVASVAVMLASTVPAGRRDRAFTAWGNNQDSSRHQTSDSPAVGLDWEEDTFQTSDPLD
jgi:hypothetical protein